MTSEKRFARRQVNSRYEVYLQIAGVIGLFVAAWSLLRFGFYVAVGFMLGGAVAVAVGKLFAVLNALQDQMEALEQKLERREGNNEGGNKGP